MKLKWQVPLILLLLPSLSLIFTLTPTVQANYYVLFSRTWGGTNYEQASGLTIDPSGNVWVVGSTSSFGAGGLDAFILQYDSSGNLNLQKTWGGAGTDAATGVTSDASGNIYVVGYTNSFGTGGGTKDVFLLKLDSSGSLSCATCWQRTWGAGGDDAGYAIAVNSTGDIFVTGYTTSFGAGSADAFLLGFDSSGNLLFQRTWAGSGYDAGNGLAIDSSGNIYVTGLTSSFGAGRSDLFLLKFDSRGNLIWQETWGSVGDEAGYGVALDTSENVYVAGFTNSFGAGGNDALLLKFSPSGSLLWQRTWGGTFDDVAYGVLAAYGFVYVTGATSSFTAGVKDVFLLVADYSGNFWNSFRWGGISDDVGFAIAPSNAVPGVAYVAGVVGEANPTGSPLGYPNFGIPMVVLQNPVTMAGHPTATVGSLSVTLGNPAGITTYAGGYDSVLLNFGYIPGIRLQVQPQNPPCIRCRISFGGIPYPSGSTGNYSAGTYNISVSAPSGWRFLDWSSSGGVSVADSALNKTTVTITHDGNLTAQLLPPSSPSGIEPTILTLTGASVALTACVFLRRRSLRSWDIRTKDAT